MSMSMSVDIIGRQDSIMACRSGVYNGLIIKASKIRHRAQFTNFMKCT
jgi:hypothetical protein